MDRVDPNRNPHSNHLTALAQAARALERRAGYANARMLQAECHMELAEFSEAAAAY